MKLLSTRAAIWVAGLALSVLVTASGVSSGPPEMQAIVPIGPGGASVVVEIDMKTRTVMRVEDAPGPPSGPGYLNADSSYIAIAE